MKAVVAALLLAFVSCGCSDEGSAPAAGQPAVPQAELTPLDGGNGVFIASPLGGVALGYEEHEYLASGTATSWQSSEALTDDGLWSFEPDSTAEYRTRVLVRRPSDAAAASGTVIVEWLNVSGGVDADPEYASLSEEVTREGHVWVGVSAQLVGVEGGPVLVAAGGSDLAGKGLKAIDPARYGSLHHPGDGYAFDIFTQVARAVRGGGEVLGGIHPDRVIAAGESQSAFALTTYYDGVQPLSKAFDAFFVHSRAAVPLPLVGDGEYADIVKAILSPVHPVFRDDLQVPVLDLQSESASPGS